MTAADYRKKGSRWWRRSRWNRSLNLRLRQLILSAQPCADCGEPPNPAAPFEFAVKPSVDRRSRIFARIIDDWRNTACVFREMAQCDVVCPDCLKQRVDDCMHQYCDPAFRRWRTETLGCPPFVELDR